MKKFILILIITILFGCDNPVEPEYLHTHIWGIVTDGDQGFPLDSVKVFLFRKETHFDGTYFWTDVIRIKEVLANEQGLYQMFCKVEGKDKYVEMYWMGAERNGYIKTGIYSGKLVGRSKNQRIDIQLRKAL